MLSIDLYYSTLEIITTSVYIKDIIYLVTLRVSIASNGLDRLRFLKNWTLGLLFRLSAELAYSPCRIIVISR